MKYFIIVYLLSLICVRTKCQSLEKQYFKTSESEAIQFLKEANVKLAEQNKKYSIASWNYDTNINNETSSARIKALKVYSDFQKDVSNEAKKYDWTNFTEYNRRQFEKLTVIGISALNRKDEDEYVRVTTEMEAIYSTAKVCVDGKCELSLEPDLYSIMSTSTDYDKLTETWVKWRDATGKRMRQNYIIHYTLGNKAATLNIIPTKKFNTMDDLWLYPWETPDIKEQTTQLLQQLKPLYEKLHAYVRMKLDKIYPGKLPKDGTIPAHILGNIWAQQWSYILDTSGVDPYPEVKPIDVTKELQKSYNAMKLFKLSERFFIDLGLDPMTKEFWNNSVIEKTNGKDMVCQPSASDFFDGKDFRIKQCTTISMEYLIIIHHEMGHIQYFQQYKNQPPVYREGANPGFHEAIGDLLSLSVSTPQHLHTIGLLPKIDKSMKEKTNLKYQLKMALDKLVLLPWTYIVDKWRWDVFSGKVSSDDLNRHWWQLRGDYQGLSPPVKRSENDFDPGSKYHIPGSVEYIRYFVSHILQFQFHKTLCSFSQKDKPLHECDINGDKKAGALLKKILKKGSSEKWPAQLKEFTGSDKMDVKPLLEYFQPLNEFLDKVIAENKLIPGWKFNVDDYFENNSIFNKFWETIKKYASNFG